VRVAVQLADELHSEPHWAYETRLPVIQPLNQLISVCFRLVRAGPLIGDLLKAGLHYTGWRSSSVNAFVEIMRVSEKPVSVRSERKSCYALNIKAQRWR